MVFLPRRGVDDEEGGRTTGAKMSQKLAVVIVHCRDVQSHQRDALQMPPHRGVGKDLALDAMAHRAPVRPYVDESEAILSRRRSQRLMVGGDIPHHVCGDGQWRTGEEGGRYYKATCQKRSPRQARSLLFLTMRDTRLHCSILTERPAYSGPNSFSSTAPRGAPL